MSSRFSKAMVFALALLFAIVPLALAQTFGTGGQLGTGTPGSGLGPGIAESGVGPGTPGSPTSQAGTGITGDPGSGPNGMGPGTPGSPTNRPGMGLDRPGTGIIEQPGSVSPGTETPGSPAERRGDVTGQSGTDTGSNPTTPGAGPPGLSGTRSTGAGAAGGVGR